KASQYVKLVANTAYFRGAPTIDTLIYQYVPSDSSRELAYTKGELDAFVGKRENVWVNRFRKEPHTIVDVFEPGELRTLHLNMTVKPLNDVRVRRAIAYALNREELRDYVGKSVTRVDYSPLPVGYLGYTDDLPKYPYDPGKAKALLAEAGYPAGFTIKAIITKLPALLNPMQVIQEQLRRGGLPLDLVVVEHSALPPQIRQDPRSLVAYGAARFPGPRPHLPQFYHS